MDGSDSHARRSRMCTSVLQLLVIHMGCTCASEAECSSTPATCDLIGVLGNRTSLMRDVAASKLAVGTSCPFDGVQELAVLEAAAAIAVRHALPTGPAVLFSQIVADCGKQAQEHWLHNEIELDDRRSLVEIRKLLQSMNEVMFSRWKQSIEEWEGMACAVVHNALSSRLGSELEGRCSEPVYKLALSSALLSAGRADCLDQLTLQVSS